MRLLKSFLLLFLVTAMSAPMVLAGLTGVIAGKITDAEGNPIPGVTVSVTGEGLPGARVDTTSATGTFRMPELAPGLYMVKAELMGMKTIEQSNVKVSVNSTSQLKLTMEMAEFKETIVITAAADLLDVKAATVKTTIERDVTERLPGSDDLFSSFAMAGGITGSGNVRVHGGAFTDNLYLFDGVDTTDPVTSTFGANLNADAIQEVEVQTGGFQAEYGRSRGGIVNAVTKSGSNEFHGIIRLKYINTDWQADSEHATTESNYDFWEPTVTLDGPILKDKLWFLVTYQYSNQEGTDKTIGFYGADFQNADDMTNIKTDREFNLPYAKLTFQPNQEHKFVVNYSGEDATIYGTVGEYDSYTPEAYNLQEQGGPFYSLEWTWLYSSNLFFITRVGSSNGFLDSVPAADTGEPSFFDTTESQRYNNSNRHSEDDRNRLQMSFTGSYYVDELAGSHEFKSGIEIHNVSRDNFNVYPGDYDYTITQHDHGDYYTGNEATRDSYLHPGTATESGNYASFFLQDTWTVLDNLTLNLGVRYEYMTFENADGDTAVPAWTWGQFRADSYRNEDGTFKQYSDMKFTDMIAPRIGANWDVFGDGKTAIHGFYGRFYNPFDLSLPGMFQSFEANNSANRTEEYIGPEWHDMDRNGVPDEDYFFDPGNWKTTREDEPGDWNLIDPDLKAEYTDEMMVGIEHELFENFSIGLNYTHRESNDMLEDVGIFTDENGNIVWTYLGGVKDDFSGLDPDEKFDPVDSKTYSSYDKNLFYVTNASGNSRKYDGIEINASARLKYYDLQASYTYAEAIGSVTETFPDSDGVGQFSSAYDTFAASQNLYGELPWSCRHYVKLAGSVHYDLTDWYEISFGVNGFWRSGYHYSKRSKPPFTFDPTDPTNNQSDPDTWTGRPPRRDENFYFMEERGTYELPGFYSIDVSLQNSLKFGKWGTATVIFDVENVTDNQGLISEVELYNPSKPDLFGQANGWASPMLYRLSLKYAF